MNDDIVKEQNPTVYMMVGLPGSGKSTAVKEVLEKYNGLGEEYTIYSTDAFIESEAEKWGKTYNEVFDEYIKPAKIYANGVLEYAFDVGRDIVWDQTNVSVKARAKKIRRIRNAKIDYDIVAVYVNTPVDVCKLRNNRRDAGRRISGWIIDRMATDLEKPTTNEDFDYIMWVD